MLYRPVRWTLCKLSWRDETLPVALNLNASGGRCFTDIGTPWGFVLYRNGSIRIRIFRLPESLLHLVTSGPGLLNYKISATKCRNFQWGPWFKFILLFHAQLQFYNKSFYQTHKPRF